jgi:cytochrome b involved in lipid metabolism
VAIDGQVFDFTEFLDEHPAGAEAILKYAGKDGSDIFHAIHTPEMLADFKPIGTVEHSSAPLQVSLSASADESRAAAVSTGPKDDFKIPEF